MGALDNSACNALLKGLGGSRGRVAFFFGFVWGRGGKPKEHHIFWGQKDAQLAGVWTRFVHLRPGLRADPCVLRAGPQDPQIYGLAGSHLPN